MATTRPAVRTTRKAVRAALRSLAANDARAGGVSGGIEEIDRREGIDGTLTDLPELAVRASQRNLGRGLALGSREAAEPNASFSQGNRKAPRAFWGRLRSNAAPSQLGQ